MRTCHSIWRANLFTAFHMPGRGNMTSLVMAHKFSHKFSHKFWIHRFPYSRNTLLMCVWPVLPCFINFHWVFESSNPNIQLSNHQDVLHWSVFSRWKSVKSCRHGKRVSLAHALILTRLQFWCHCAKLEVILSSTTIDKKFDINFLRKWFFSK